MALRTRLPSHVVREAAELLVARDHIKRLMQGDHDSGPTIKSYLVRLARARGTSDFIHHNHPHPGAALQRCLTVAVKSYNGTYRASIIPGPASWETCLTFMDTADGGLLDRDRVWGDPRYIGALSRCFGPDGTASWWATDPDRGVVARAAWAATILGGLRKKQVPTASKGWLGRQLHHNLFETLRQTTSGQHETFSGTEDPYTSCWTVTELDRVIKARIKTTLPSPRPPTVPLQLLRHRGSLGYGELIAFWLMRDPQGPGLTQAETAFTLGLEDRKSASRLATTAQRKLEPKSSLLELVPPFPAPSQSSSDPRDTPSAKPSRLLKRRRGGE